MLGIVAALIAPLVTMIAFYINLSGKTTANAERIGILEARAAQQEERLGNRLERISNNVNWLCNERRRDNQQAGVNANTECQ